MTVSMVCNSLRLVCDTAEILGKIQQSPDANVPRSLKIAIIGSDILVLGLRTTEIIASSKGTPNETLLQLKMYEVLLRTLTLPLKIVYDNIKELTGEDRSISKIFLSIAEKIASIVRSSYEICAYRESLYLDLSQEEFNTAQQPIFKKDENDVYSVVDYKKLNKAECKEILKECESSVKSLGIIKVALKTHKIITTARDLYRNLANSLQNGTQNGTAINPINAQARQQRIIRARQNMEARLTEIQTRQAAVTAAQATPIALSDINSAYRMLDENFDPFNLLAYSFIPTPLHDDLVFKRYICPITRAPIRYPVGDPNGITVYEKAAIETALRFSPVSPVTRRPLTTAQLQPLPFLQAYIDGRLKSHEDRLRMYIQSGFGLGVSEAATDIQNQQLNF